MCPRKIYKKFKESRLAMRIAVVGSGYVGLVTGACFADLGHQVVLVDNDEKKLASLRNAEIPIHEKILLEFLGRYRGGGAPPTESREADRSYVESVPGEISGGVASYKVVVKRSTVPVNTSQWIRT